ncbi:glutathione S-transferase family protein [Roseovarius sp.]
MERGTSLYGFDGSTYVRRVKMVLADKGMEYQQDQIDVLAGEPHKPEQLARHPFGKVPVLDIDGIRIRETDAICRYIEDARPEPGLIPADPRQRAAAGLSFCGRPFSGQDACMMQQGHILAGIFGGDTRLAANVLYIGLGGACLLPPCLTGRLT